MVATARCTAIRTTTGLFATTEPLFFTANKSVEQAAGPTAGLLNLVAQDYLERYPDGYTCHFIRPDWKVPRRAVAAGG